MPEIASFSADGLAVPVVNQSWSRRAALALALASVFASACEGPRSSQRQAFAGPHLEPSRPAAPAVQAAAETVRAADEPAAPPPATTPPLDMPSTKLLEREEEGHAVPAMVSFEGPPTPESELHRPSGELKTQARPLALALEAFLANRPDDAIRHLQGYAPRDQEIVMRLLPLLSAIDEKGVATSQPKPDQIQQFVSTLEQIEHELKPLAPLRLERLAFCEGVRAFGDFKPASSNRFAPGQWKWLYAEIGNLVDRRLPNGLYHVRLQGLVEIFGSDGKPIGPVAPLPVDAASASPRQDYFVRITFRVPPQLPPGQYTVRVRIDDLDTNRAAEATLPFQVVGTR